MPRRLVNSYAPQTPIGAGLSNIAIALFGGQGSSRSEEKDFAQSQAHLAHARLYQSQAQKADAEREQIEAVRAARENLTENTARAHLPADQVPHVMNYLKGQPVLAFKDGVAPRPDVLTPEIEAKLRTTQGLQPLAQASSPTSNIHQFGQALGLLQEQDYQRRTQRGEMTPTQYFQLSGKSPFTIQDGTVLNQAEGTLGGLTMPGEARIGTSLSQQRRNDAAAGASSAAAGASNALSRQRDALTGQIAQGLNLPPEVVNVGGTGTFATRADAIGQPAGARPSPTKPEKPPKLDPAQTRVLAETIKADEKKNGEFDQETKRRIHGRATELAQDPESGFFNNPAMAVEQAISETGGFEGGKGYIWDTPRRAKTSAPVTGQVSGGGGSIDRNKPVIQNPDGSISTERTITVQADGKHYVIPTIVGGKQLTDDQAVQAWVARQNKEVGVFDTADEANAFARFRSEEIGRQRGRGARATPAGRPAPAAPAGGNAPPAAIEFYRQNRSKPGIRQQFIQKYGFDPEGA